MARSPVTEAECQALLAVPKRIVDDVLWVQKPNENWIETRLTVTGRFAGAIELIGSMNAEVPERYSFSLVFNRGNRISGLDVNGSHRNT